MNPDTHTITEEEIDLDTLTITEEGISVTKDKELILHNDDHNSFDHVIDCLVEICKHTFRQAEQCAHIVHHNGKCPVKKGPIDVLKEMKSSLESRGLTVTID